MTGDTTPDVPSEGWRPSRRDLLIGGLGALGAYAAWTKFGADPLAKLEDEAAQRAATFVAKATKYDESLATTIIDGLAELGVGRDQVRGKRVLLKPNLVETDPNAPHINTHPMVIVGAAEAFRRLDAAEVAVAEGQGHRRDSWLVLEESGLLDVLDQAKLPYTDLNHDDLFEVRNKTGLTKLPSLVLPKRLQWADLLVSLPKLKTHHWVGCTLSMKNLFGIVPGVYYGWPKNVLHQRGIERSIIDINATVPFHLAIVDGILGMEGDGPIRGEAKPANVLVMGSRLPSVDATCARIMGLRVESVTYLLEGSFRGLGPIREAHVDQRGASIAQVRTPFKVAPAPHLKKYAGG